jgi:hypothetical protein
MPNRQYATFLFTDCGERYQTGQFAPRPRLSYERRRKYQLAEISSAQTSIDRFGEAVTHPEGKLVVPDLQTWPRQNRC